MKKTILFVIVGVVCMVSVNAATVAHWQFEEGPAGAPVTHGGAANGVYYEGTADSSGNGYGLSVFAEGWAGFVYRNQGAEAVASGNNFSVKNSGGLPAMFTDTADAINGIQPAAFTVEASFKLENGGYRTIVGRDSQGSVTGGDLNLAALYFQAMPGNQLAIKFCDVSGVWHEAISAADAFRSFDYPTNNDGIGVPWYSMAATSDGTLLSLYLRNANATGVWTLIAQTDMSGSSANTALTKGTGDGGDWNAGDWSVGRGLYAGGHGDRAYGFIDEVRISDSALGVGDFLMVIPEPATMILLGLGSLALLRKQK